MKKVYLLAIAILMFNCHNAQNTADEANKKHFLNLETEENEQTF